ncbi:MAG TPA: glycosyltransferase family 4 protein [Gemmatimonadales bacterium]|nr:glycosyltransferase family 4 protein [Gemmatimonadales bacterium]
MTPTPKVAYVITRSDSIGGGHIHIRDVALELRARGGEPVVVVGGEGPFTEELRGRAIPYRSLRHLVRPIHPWHDVAAFFELRAVLRELRPDLVSTHAAKAGWLAALAAASLGIPCIQTTHGWSFTTGVPRVAAYCYRWLERIGVLAADRVIAVCDYDRQLALRYHVAPAPKVTTVHNGMPDIAPELRTTPEGSPVRLVMVARFETQKDHGTLLHALAGLRGRAWQLDLIGDGPDRAQIAALAQDLGIADRVHFLGARNDVAEHLARSQVFLLISRWEGFPRSILEAMRAGLPVVASDVGGVSESVAEFETGFLVPSGDVGALQSRLELLLEFPTLRRRLGRAGRARYEAQFTFDHMFERTASMYGELSRRRTLPAPALQRASTT